MKTLKSKMLGKKVMMSLLTAGVLTVGVCGSAYAESVNVTGKDETLNVADSISVTGNVVGVSINVANLTALNETTVVNVGSTEAESVSITSETGRTIHNASGILNIRGKNITLKNSGSENIRTRGYGITTIGGSETKNIIITSAGDAINLMPYAKDGKGVAHTNAKVNIVAQNVVINADGTGIWAQNNGTDKINYNNITVDADSIKIKAGENGIVSISQSEVILNGNVDIEAKNVISTRGYSKTSINSNGDKTVKLNGNIAFEYDGPTSGTCVDATVNVNLAGADSVWNGNSLITWDKMSNENWNQVKDELLKVNGFTVALSNGAQWNPTQIDNKSEKDSDNKWSGQQYTAINNLIMNDGVVNIPVNKSIDVDNLLGTKATFKNGTVKVISEYGVDELVLDAAKLNAAKSLNINKGVTVANAGHLDSDGDITIKSGATIKIDDLANHREEAPITATGKVTAEKGVKVVIDKAEKGKYKVIEAEGGVDNKMADEDTKIASGLMEGKWVNTATTAELEVSVAELAEITAPIGDEEIIPLVTSQNKDFLQEAAENAEKLAKNPETKGFADLINAVQKMMAEAGNSAESIKQGRAAFAGALQSVEAGGATSTAVSIVNNVAGVTGGHMSMATPSMAGGKGVGLMDAGSGAGVWAQYVHGKDKAEKMPMNGGSTKYSNSYNGIVVGADFKQVSKFQSGIAFNYVDGDGSSVFNEAISGHTDFKAYGLTYYGAIKNDTANTMFDVSYNRSKAESKQENLGGEISATQKTNTWSAGVTVEKAFRDEKNGAQFIPYVGARYMRIGTDDYANNIGVKTAVENQNIFLIPVGIKMRQENKLKSGWTVTPKMDLSYVWALGDTDNDMTVSAPGLNSTSRLGYTVMDNGSFLGTIGLEASKSNWTYGLSFSYQKGDYQESKKYFVDVKYTF